MANKVIGAMAAVHDEQGRIQYLYQNTAVPEYVSDEELKHLKDVGLVGDEDDAPVDSMAPAQADAAASKSDDDGDKFKSSRGSK